MSIYTKISVQIKNLYKKYRNASPPTLTFPMIKQQKLDEVARSAQRETRRTGLTDAQLNDRDFLHRLIEMCETHNDPRCGTARARLAEIER